MFINIAINSLNSVRLLIKKEGAIAKMQLSRWCYAPTTSSSICTAPVQAGPALTLTTFPPPPLFFFFFFFISPIYSTLISIQPLMLTHSSYFCDLICLRRVLYKFITLDSQFEVSLVLLQIWKSYGSGPLCTAAF